MEIKIADNPFIYNKKPSFMFVKSSFILPQILPKYLECAILSFKGKTGYGKDKT